VTAFAPQRAAGPNPPRACQSDLRPVLRRAVCAALVLACAGFAATLTMPLHAHAADAPANAPAANTSGSAPEGASVPAARPGGGTAGAPGASGTTTPQAATPAQTQQPPQTQMQAPTPPQTPSQTPYGPNGAVRFGSAAVFRNLIPSPMLESQAAAEFDEIARGASHANRLYPDTDARVKRVRAITDQLIPYSLKWNDRAKGWKWSVAIVRSPDIRMYCLPGGKIVIYGGLLDRVRLNDNELAMLLGHEIAHALREHARERLGEQQAAQLGSGSIPQLFGLADLGEAPLGIGSQLVEMKYEKADETEADVIGSDIASRAGFDPRAAITLWDKLAVATRSNRTQGFIYVHPYSPERRADIMKRLADMLPLYAKAIGKTVDVLPDYAGIGRPRSKFARD